MCIIVKDMRLTVSMAMALVAIAAAGKCIYVAPDGKPVPEADGTIERPYASLVHAQHKVQPGDTVYFRGGIYKPQVEDAAGIRERIYSCAFILDKDGDGDKRRISYLAYPGERPVFDMSDFKPEGQRVSVFYVSGSWLHIKGLDVTGTQVTISTSNTQSECFSNRGGNNNIYENLSMHDGMGIGFYLVKGADNLVLNCDAYNNFETVSGRGGNVDGFGCHPAPGGTGNVIRGCRAWWNSDDGFDLINSAEAVSIDSCWAFYNGYFPGTFDSAADGNGIKAGGYGMKEKVRKISNDIPMHRVTNSLAYRNKAGGMYANHHLGGIYWSNNTASQNEWNFRMINRKSREEAVDVDGYDHVLLNNLSHSPRGVDLAFINEDKCRLENNAFTAVPDSEFISVDHNLLTAPRKADGSLPDIDFLKPKPDSSTAVKKQGYTFTDKSQTK